MSPEFGYFYFYLLLLAFLAQSAWIGFRAWPAGSRARSVALRAALAGLSLLAGFVAVEGVFFFCIDVTDGHSSQLGTYRWMARHLPQPLGTYRGRPLPAPGGDAAGTFVVVVVGDSSTFGQGVARAEDLYPSLLERRLRGAGLDAAVYNVSYMGWDTFDEWRALQEAALALPRVDAVVLGFSLNDIAPHVPVPADFAAATARLASPPAALAPLVRRSLFASWLHNRWVLLTSPALRQGSRALYAGYRDPATFAALARDLDTFRALVDSLGARLFVAIFPDAAVPWEVYPNRDIHRALAGFWAGRGVPVADLLEEFERRPQRALHASWMDSHPNALAHRIAADRIAALVAGAAAVPAGGAGPR